MVRVQKLIVFLLCTIALAAEPAIAGKKVEPLSTVVETDVGKIFVSALLRPQNSSTMKPEPPASAASFSSLINDPEKPLRQKIVMKAPADRGDRIVSVNVYILGGEKIRAELDPAAWRKKLGYEFLPNIVRTGTFLVFDDGSTSKAMFGPDDNVILFWWDLGWVFTDEDGDVAERNYIWQKKEPYLALVSLDFPVFTSAWKQKKPVAIRIGETELVLTDKARWR